MVFPALLLALPPVCVYVCVCVLDGMTALLALEVLTHSSVRDFTPLSTGVVCRIRPTCDDAVCWHHNSDS